MELTNENISLILGIVAFAIIFFEVIFLISLTGTIKIRSSFLVIPDVT